MLKFVGIICAVLFYSTACSANSLFPLLAEGKWELHPDRKDDVSTFSCDDEPLIITIDLENMRYVSTREGYREEASILEIGNGLFWIRYDDEARLDDNGEPVEWAWIADGDDQFYWARRDWPSGSGTNRRRRCPPPAATS